MSNKWLFYMGRYKYLSIEKAFWNVCVGTETKSVYVDAEGHCKEFDKMRTCMKSMKILTGMALVAVILSKTVSAEIGTGPESVMGLGTEGTTEFSFESDENRFSISRLTSPFVSITSDDDITNQSFSLDYSITGDRNSYHLSLVNIDTDIHGTAGIGFDTLKLSTHYGNSEGILSSRQGISGISPNFFHGAVSYDYNYGGSTLGISLSDDSMIHGGATFINGEGLENRSVYYSGFSYKRFFSNFSSVKRSYETVGYSIVAGFKLDSYEITYQELNSYYEANWREVTIGFTDIEKLSRVRLSLGVGSNGLHEAAEESRAALIYSIPLGGESNQSRRSNQYRPNDEPASQLTSSLISFNKLREAGFRAVGSGVALSSGNANLDRTPRFRSQHKAAHYVLSNFNPISVRQNREYGSSIYQNRDRTYSPNRYVSIGNHESVLITPYYRIPYGTRPTATWHTHGAYMPQYANEQFSFMDIQSSIDSNLDGYLGTPFGRMRFFDVETRYIYTFINKNGSEFVLPH